MSRPLIAIDATLVGGTNTGDSSYWTGLTRALARDPGQFDYALLSFQEPAFPTTNQLRWIKLSGTPGRFASLVRLPLTARKLGAAAYHTQYSLSPLARNGITTIHDVSFFIGPEWFRWKDRLMLQTFVPSSAKRAKKVITVSESSRRDIVKYLKLAAEKVVVTYNGVEDYFRPVPFEETLSRLGIQQPYLLAIGTRWPRKNIGLAIEAAKIAGQRLVIVGKPGWKETIDDSVTYTGYLQNETLPAVYSGASLLLFPSHYEGFGIPMVEAFACGTPVLASSGGSLPEVSGGAAEIMPTWDVQSWAMRIEELLSDSGKLADMRLRGFERAKRFTWSETAAVTKTVYREVAG